MVHLDSIALVAGPGTRERATVAQGAVASPFAVR